MDEPRTPSDKYTRQISPALQLSGEYVYTWPINRSDAVPRYTEAINKLKDDLTGEQTARVGDSTYDMPAGFIRNCVLLGLIEVVEVGKGGTLSLYRGLPRLSVAFGHDLMNVEGIGQSEDFRSYIIPLLDRRLQGETVPPLQQVTGRAHIGVEVDPSLVVEEAEPLDEMSDGPVSATVEKERARPDLEESEVIRLDMSVFPAADTQKVGVMERYGMVLDWITGNYLANTYHYVPGSKFGGHFGITSSFLSAIARLGGFRPATFMNGVTGKMATAYRATVLLPYLVPTDLQNADMITSSDEVRDLALDKILERLLQNDPGADLTDWVRPTDEYQQSRVVTRTATRKNVKDLPNMSREGMPVSRDPLTRIPVLSSDAVIPTVDPDKVGGPTEPTVEQFLLGSTDDHIQEPARTKGPRILFPGEVVIDEDLAKQLARAMRVEMKIEEQEKLVANMLAEANRKFILRRDEEAKVARDTYWLEYKTLEDLRGESLTTHDIIRGMLDSQGIASAPTWLDYFGGI